MATKDLKCMIDAYWEEVNEDKRYSSFDFCYNYFHSHQGNLVGMNMQTSCMQLWSYLASWGMIVRGNEIQNKNFSCLKDVVKYINEHTEFYNLSIDDDAYVKQMMNLYQGIKTALNFKQPNQKTLITKIILGVYACCPAMDSRFSKTFGISVLKDLRKKDLEKIVSFYKSNESTLKLMLKAPKNKCFAFDGGKTSLPYTISKLIDMYGFQKNEKCNEK